MDPSLQTAANIGGMNNEPNNNPYVPPVSTLVPTDGNGSHKKAWPMITILIVVLVLVVAALYLFASGSNDQATLEGTDNTIAEGQVDEQGGAVTEEPQSVQPVTNTADDTQSLEQDLNSAIEGLETQNF